MKFLDFSKIAFLLAFSLILFTGCGDDDDDDDTTPIDNSIYTETTDAATGRSGFRVAATADGTGTTTWTKDNVYILDGFVFVNEGQTLTIEAGTVIKGRPGEGEQASALIVARGGRIIAEGTASEPIIFTAEADNLNGNLGSQPGQWGGLIVLGNATQNTVPGEQAIEGIPTTEPRGIYGGTNDNDNSGVLRYISIRHGGSDIGAGNEINGLSLGAVGSGTTIEYIEVFANADDGIEWYGGTVNAKYLVVTACGDDAFDYDQGYRGSNQFGLIYYRDDANFGGTGGEHDGGTDPEDGAPFATPKFFNVTSIGQGSNRTLVFRDNAGGEYHNSIFGNYGRGISIELLPDGESSFRRFEAGQLKIANSSFFNVANNDASSIFIVDVVDAENAEAEATFAASFDTEGNTVGSLGVSRSSVVPTQAGASFSTPTSSFIEATNYRGAIAPGATPWINGWTATENFIQ